VVADCDDVLVAHNQYLDVAAVGANIFTLHSGTTGIVADRNIFPASIGSKKAYADFAFTVGFRAKIDGTTYVCVADDGVALLEFEHSLQQGLVSISTLSSLTTTVPRGIYFIRAPTGQEIVTGLTEWNITGVSKTTGALTGTTGANGNTTISATAGKLYLENRTGASRFYAVTFM
jgi:hypothetical protein